MKKVAGPMSAKEHVKERLNATRINAYPGDVGELRAYFDRLSHCLLLTAAYLDYLLPRRAPMTVGQSEVYRYKLLPSVLTSDIYRIEWCGYFQTGR